MIGTNRMGANMVRHTLRAGHQCIVYDLQPEAMKAVPGPVHSAAQYEPVSLLGESDFAAKVLSAPPYPFVVHEETATANKEAS